MKLGEIATVRSGLVLSRKLAQGSSPFRYQLLNLKSISPKGYIKMDQLDWYDATEALSEEYLTHDGDLVIRLSVPYTAVLIDKSTEGIVISSNFAIVRVSRSMILPAYLQWLLNTAQVKKQIFENTSSNMLGAVKPKFFCDFEISLLPLKDQQQIADLHALAQKEILLLTELAEQKEAYYASAIDKIQKQMRKEHGYDEQKRY